MAGSRLGACFGLGHLEERWLAPFNDEIHTGLGCFYEQSLSQVAKRMGELPQQVAGADIQVAAEAKNGAQAVALAREHVPDVILIDLLMPEMDGVEAIEQEIAGLQVRDEIVWLIEDRSDTYEPQ